MSSVSGPSNLVNTECFNSYVDFGSEKLVLAFMDKTKGPNAPQKSHKFTKKTISCQKLNRSSIRNAILNQFMLGEIFVQVSLK